MNPVVLLFLLLAGAYLIGGVPFGYIVARCRGVNIFEQGSGNIGATNVGRVLGRRFGILVFLLDFAKGALPVALALGMVHSLGEQETIPHEAFGVGAGLAAFLGHLFPPYLRFRGGKGVATGAGVVVVLFPAPAAAALVAWAAVVLATRTVALASLVAAGALCVMHLSMTPEPFARGQVLATSFCLVAAGLVVLRHRANIKRLWLGTENRLGESKAMNQLSKTVHVMSLGLWFGSVVFFVLVVTPSIFSTFTAVGTNPDRPNWFPLKNTVFAKHADGPKEQGSRAAGYTVGPLFTWFFVLQGVCGLLAAATCLNWARTHPGERVHRLRGGLVLAALVTVLVGWPIERKVADLRGPRNQATDAYLDAGAAATDAQREAMHSARHEFGMWHLASLGLSYLTLILVTVAMALAARLPADKSQPVSEPVVTAPSSMMGDDTIVQAPEMTSAGRKVE